MDSRRSPAYSISQSDQDPFTKTSALHTLSFVLERTNVSFLVYSCVYSDACELVCTQELSIAALDKARIYGVPANSYVIEHTQEYLM